MTFVKGDILDFLKSAASQIPLCQMTQELNPGLLLHLHWQSETPTARLNLWFMITLTNGNKSIKEIYCNLTEEQIPDKFEIDVGEILRVQ